MQSTAWEYLNLARRWAAGRNFRHEVKRVGRDMHIYVSLEPGDEGTHIATVAYDWEGDRESVAWLVERPPGF